MDDFEAAHLREIVAPYQPIIPKCKVIFFAPPPLCFFKSGKLSSLEFLPEFSRTLGESGFGVNFTCSLDVLRGLIKNAEISIVVCIYTELEGYVPSGKDLEEVLSHANLVFNHPRSGVIISNKPSSNKAMARTGCRLPREANALMGNVNIFSNTVSGTGDKAYVINIDSSLDLDCGRHNVEFINTTLNYRGNRFFSTMRLMCVNNYITHKFIRLRNVLEGDATVHAKDTPLNYELINKAFEKVNERAGEQFQDLANSVFQAFGPGFYCHDTLLCSETNKLFICETGYKFNDSSYQLHLKDIIREIHSMKENQNAHATARVTGSFFLRAVNALISDFDHV